MFHQKAYFITRLWLTTLIFNIILTSSLFTLSTDTNAQWHYVILCHTHFDCSAGKWNEYLVLNIIGLEAVNSSVAGNVNISQFWTGVCDHSPKLAGVAYEYTSVTTFADAECFNSIYIAIHSPRRRSVTRNIGNAVIPAFQSATWNSKWFWRTAKNIWLNTGIWPCWCWH